MRFWRRGQGRKERPEDLSTVGVRERELLRLLELEDIELDRPPDRRVLYLLCPERRERVTDSVKERWGRPEVGAQVADEVQVETPAQR